MVEPASWAKHQHWAGDLRGAGREESRLQRQRRRQHWHDTGRSRRGQQQLADAEVAGAVAIVVVVLLQVWRRVEAGQRNLEASEGCFRCDCDGAWWQRTPGRGTAASYDPLQRGSKGAEVTANLRFVAAIVEMLVVE